MMTYELDQPLRPRRPEQARLSELIHGCIARPIAGWHSGPDYFEWSAEEPNFDQLAYLIRKLTYHNYIIWHQEDLARSRDDHVVAAAKRVIDRHNQARNDQIEQIDRHVVRHEQTNPAAPVVSETIGGLLDRITVVRLKIYHLTTLAQPQHLPRLNRHFQQYTQLQLHAIQLWTELQQGSKRIEVFEQYKQYNNSSTNHVLTEVQPCAR